MANSYVGTGGDYTTWTSWEASLGTLTEDEYGIGYSEELVENFYILGNTPGSYMIYMTSDSTDEANYDLSQGNHASGNGNTRIKSNDATCLRIRDIRVDVSWIEFEMRTSNYDYLIVISNIEVASENIKIHHCCFHGDGSGTPANGTIYIADPDPEVRFYRNVIYGSSATGIHIATLAASSVFYYNTIYKNNTSDTAGLAGFRSYSTNATVMYNALFDNNVADIFNTTGVYDYNYTGDGTGDAEGANGVADLDVSEQFVGLYDDSSNGWDDVDLHVLTGADLIGNGVSVATTNYPEINKPINDRNNTISGDWDIGACQIAVSNLSIDTSDSITITESAVLGALDIQVSTSDSITITESVTPSIPAVNLSVSVYDSITITESVTVDIPLNTNVYDSITITESVSVDLDLLVNSNDSVTITESTDIDIPININTNDSVTITEDVSIGIPLSINTSDSITISENVDIGLPLGINTSDSISIDESLSNSLPLNAIAFDSVTATEYTNVLLDLLVQGIDNITISEYVSLLVAQSGLLINANDSLVIQESVNLYLDKLNVSAFDSISVTEAIEIAKDITIDSSDTLTVSEYIDLSISAIGIDVSDSITISEYVNVVLNLLSSVNDNVSITEYVNIIFDKLLINTNEDLTVSEYIDVKKDFNLVVNDDIIINEYASLTIPGLNIDISVYENISVSESVTTNRRNYVLREVVNKDSCYTQIKNKDSCYTRTKNKSTEVGLTWRLENE